ncbi:MAG: hypothetical protein ACJ790_21700 [Myxococcaceae bacterium]
MRGAILGALLWAGCGGMDSGQHESTPVEEQSPPDSGGTTTPPGGNPNGADAGTTPKPDAGVKPDAGTPAKDAGTGPIDAGSAPVDAGTPDAGLPPINFPNSAGWTFYGPQDGLPAHLYGISADEGGNLWVAGGEDGLFLLRPGATTFEKFTMADGLHPYGFMPDGSDAPGPHYLKVISVEGGPSGTVFVGYEGKPPGPGQVDCEGNWDNANPDPSIYKSGDADKVKLTSSGISVVHYDIFSGPASAPPNEPRGREKLCNIYRLVWDKAASRIWFGANHGFAMGDANYTGNNTCNGNQSCSGLMEHVHPAVNGYPGNSRSAGEALLTGDYRGVVVDPNTHNVFFGGINRSTLFTFGTHGGLSNAAAGYWGGQSDTEGNAAFKWDIWPDAVANDSIASERTDDTVFGAATNGDGTFWVGSAANGMAHVSSSGTVLGYLKNDLISSNVSAVEADPLDGSIWAGARWGGGVNRIKGGQVTHYSLSVFGPNLANLPVTDVQSMGSGGSRKILVTFDGQGSSPGAVGIYSGS